MTWQHYSTRKVLAMLLSRPFFGLASNLTYAWIGASLRHWLRGPNDTAQRLQWFNRIMALALLCTVVWMVRSALQAP